MVIARLLVNITNQRQPILARMAMNCMEEIGYESVGMTVTGLASSHTAGDVSDMQ